MKKNNKEDDVSITFVEHELQKYELQMGQEKAEKLENFIKEEKELDLSLAKNQIELKFINDPAYLGFLGFQGVDVERINEPEYRSFLESKGIKFLTEEMSIEKEKAVKLKQEQEKADHMESIEKEKAEKLENFIKGGNQIELKFINDPSYLSYLGFQGVDIEHINEHEYRSFLEFKGIKFLTEEMSIEKEKAVKLKQEQEKVEKLENVIKEGFIQAQKESEKELDFVFTKNQIELKFINDPAYLTVLESKGVDIERINEPEYRLFLESKGVKFKLSDEFIISNHSITESEDQSSTLIGSDNIQED